MMSVISMDWEFEDTGSLILPISVGMVKETGENYYAEFLDYDWNKSSLWLIDNVKPTLKGSTYLKSKTKISNDILDFVGIKPKLLGYYSAYDAVLFFQLFGPLVDRPKQLPMWVYDIKQELDRLNIRAKMIDSLRHNALNDAEWIMDTWKKYIHKG